jgi:hypothetical protein
VTLRFDPPVLSHAARFPRPVKLEREVELLNRKVHYMGEEPDKATEQLARSHVAALVEGRAVPPFSELHRRVQIAILGIYVRLPEDSQDAVVGELADAGARGALALGWRRFWPLWESDSKRRPALASILATRLTAHWTRRQSRPDDLPGWVELHDAKSLVAVLTDPSRIVRMFVESSPVPLWNWTDASVGLSADRGVGADVCATVIREATESWWKLSEVSNLVTWGRNRCLEVSCALANRLLVELGSRGLSKPELRTDPDAQQIKRFVLDVLLGPPSPSSAHWARMSDDAARVMEDLIVADAFGNILAQFRREAERDRADFWERWENDVEDARFHSTPGGVAVCMMAIRGRLFVEFGRTGNACYVYDASALTVPLRVGKVLAAASESDFKQRDGLWLCAQRLPYVCKLSHMSQWQHQFDDVVRAGRRSGRGPTAPSLVRAAADNTASPRSSTAPEARREAPDQPPPRLSPPPFASVTGLLGSQRGMWFSLHDILAQVGLPRPHVIAELEQSIRSGRVQTEPTAAGGSRYRMPRG